MAERGVGAWSPTRYKQNMGMYSDRIRYALGSIQNELAALLLLSPSYVVTKSNGFGPKTERAVSLFQSRCGLPITGTIGPKEARRLFFPVFSWWQAAMEIPNNYLFGLARLESAMDPGAQGTVQPADRGIMQYNRDAHPDITDAVAYGNPRFCIQRGAADLKAAWERFGQWDIAIASHNSPTRARQWLELGHAPSEQIQRYVDLVKQNAGMPI